MISFTGVVINNIKHYADARLMKRLHHISEFKVLLIIVAGIRVLGVGREEVQRHIAPVVTLLWIALENRHQFDHSDPELFQIGDLLDQACICPGPRWIYA